MFVVLAYSDSREREDSPSNVAKHANNITSLSLAFSQEGSTVTVHIFQSFSKEKAGSHLINVFSNAASAVPEFWSPKKVT